MKSYSPETKAQVIAAWQSGTPAKTIARQQNIPQSTVRNWTHGLVRALVTPEKQADIDVLVTEFVIAALLGLRKVIDTVSSDEAWLKSQPIEGLATWVGVTSDKLLAVLSAYQRAGLDDQQT